MRDRIPTSSFRVAGDRWYALKYVQPTAGAAASSTTARPGAYPYPTSAS
jgi:hypothetical protein